MSVKQPVITKVGDAFAPFLKFVKGCVAIMGAGVSAIALRMVCKVLEITMDQVRTLWNYCANKTSIGALSIKDGETYDDFYKRIKGFPDLVDPMLLDLWKDIAQGAMNIGDETFPSKEEIIANKIAANPKQDVKAEVQKLYEELIEEATEPSKSPKDPTGKSVGVASKSPIAPAPGRGVI